MTAVANVFSGEFMEFLLTILLFVMGFLLARPAGIVGKSCAQIFARRQLAPESEPSCSTTEEGGCDEDSVSVTPDVSGVGQFTPKKDDVSLIQLYNSTLGRSNGDAKALGRRFSISSQTTADLSQSSGTDNSSMRGDEDWEHDFNWGEDSWASELDCKSPEATVAVDADCALEVALASGATLVVDGVLSRSASLCGAEWAHRAATKLRAIGVPLLENRALEMVQLFSCEGRADLAVHLLQAEDIGAIASSELYGSVLEVCVRAGAFEKAVSAVEHAAWCAPTSQDAQRAFLALARWLARTQDVALALRCYYAVQQRGGSVDMSTRKAILLALIRSNDMQRASEIFAEIEEAGIKADTAAFAAMICGHCATGEVDKALSQFQKMRIAGLVPAGSLFDALLDSCATNHAPALLEQVLADMEADGIQPSSSTLVALMRHHGRGGDVNRVVALFKEMPQQHGLELDVRAYSTLISVCLRNGHLGLALDAFEKMQAAKLRPSARTLESLINACRCQGHIEKAVELLDHALTLSVRLDLRAVEDLLRLIGQRRQTLHLGVPLLQRLSAAGIVVPSNLATAMVAAGDASNKMQYPALQSRREARRGWRSFSAETCP